MRPFSVIVLMSLMVVGCVYVEASDCGRPKFRHLEPDSKQLRRKLLSHTADDALIRFATLMWQKTVDDKLAMNNTLMSPISIHQALAMVVLGANKGGESEKELLKALHYDDPKKAGEDYKKILAEFKKLTQAGLEAHKGEPQDQIPPVIDIWSSLIALNDKKYAKTFLEDTKNYHNSTPDVCPKGDKKTMKKVLDKVNKWAKEAGFGDQVLTEEELIEDPDLVGVIITAIRFQAAWFKKFEKRKGKNIFYNNGDRNKPVKEGDVLTSNDSPGWGTYLELYSYRVPLKYPELEKRHSQLLKGYEEHLRELGYINLEAVDVPLDGGATFTMIRPALGGGKLKRLIGELMQTGRNGTSGLEKLITILEVLKNGNDLKKLTFPVFNFESTLDLKEPLKQMGVNRMFGERQAALLDDIMNDPRLFVSKVKHQAMVETSEFGIKAAAITKVFLAVKSQQPPGVAEIKINMPFLFLIRYKKTLLFMGQLVQV